MTGTLRRYTKRRFDRLVATQERLKRQWWESRLADGAFESKVSNDKYYQRKRQVLLQVLERELDDMCFYGLVPLCVWCVDGVIQESGLLCRTCGGASHRLGI